MVLNTTPVGATISKDGKYEWDAERLGKVGMVATVTHDGNGNAKSVSYKDNVEGPVSNIGANGVSRCWA